MDTAQPPESGTDLKLAMQNLAKQNLAKGPILLAVIIWWLAINTLGLSPCVAQTAEQVDQQRIEAAGLQVMTSPHLTLITDVRDRPEINQFNEVFEQAVQQWCDYFSLPKSEVKDWHITCCLILDPNQCRSFKALGLFPDDLPAFPAGYQRRSDIWVFQQDGTYYTRHLLLHEGTHAFMEKFLGGYGAPWYAEGMAELLGVHQWKDGKLKINYAIADSDDVPFWGRVKLIRKDRDAGKAMTLDEVLNIPGPAFQQVRAYGWAWAACEFLDSHPKFQADFRKLPAVASQSAAEFNQKFREVLADRLPDARQQFNTMVDEIQYGYDVARAEPIPVTEATADPQSTGVTEFKLAADRGWQTTGIRVRPGQRLRISSIGKYQVKHDGQPWPCDGDGVTIEYYRGRPLGRLIATVKNGDDDQLDVLDVGRSDDLTFTQAGTLWLRINESPANWQDNQGQLQIQVRPLSD